MMSPSTCLTSTRPNPASTNIESASSFRVLDRAPGAMLAYRSEEFTPVQNAQSISLLTLALGVHTVEAYASDVAGNPTRQPVSFRIVATIDSLIASVNVYA